MDHDLYREHINLSKGTDHTSFCASMIRADDKSRQASMDFRSFRFIGNIPDIVNQSYVPVDELLSKMSKRNFFKTWKVAEAEASKWLEGNDKKHLYKAGFHLGGTEVVVPYASDSSNTRDAFYDCFLNGVTQAAAGKDWVRFQSVDYELKQSRGKLWDLQSELKKFRKGFGDIDRDTGDFWEPENPRKHDKIAAALTKAEKLSEEVLALVNELIGPFTELYTVIQQHSKFSHRKGWRSRLFSSELVKFKGKKLSVTEVKDFTVTWVLAGGSFTVAVIALIFAISLLGGPFGPILVALGICCLALTSFLAFFFSLPFRTHSRAKELAKWYDDTIVEFETLNKSLEDSVPLLKSAISELEMQKPKILKEIEKELGDGLEGRSEAELAKELGRLAHYHDVVDKAEAEVYEMEVKQPPQFLENKVRGALYEAGYDEVTGPEASRSHKKKLIKKIEFSASLRRKIVLGEAATPYERNTLFGHIRSAAASLSEAELRPIVLSTILHHVESPEALDKLLSDYKALWKVLEIVDLSDQDCRDLRAAIESSNVRVLA